MEEVPYFHNSSVACNFTLVNVREEELEATR